MNDPAWDSRDNRSWHPGGPDYSDNDGLFRIYDDASGKRRVLRLEYYTCTYVNKAYIFDKGMFEPSGDLLGHAGEEICLSALYTSYGINRNVHRHAVAPGTIVLVDYQMEEHATNFIADPDSPDANARLDLGGRHLGKANALSADGSVNSFYPGQLYPQAHGELWSP